MMHRLSIVTLVTLLITILVPASLAGPVKNGNTMALDFVTAGETLRKELQEETEGRIFFFRYLLITNIETRVTNSLTRIDMNTVEPSSEMRVDFTVRKRVSLEKAKTLEKGNAVAVTGRVKSISAQKNQIVLDPVIVRYKDRLSPKAGRELLYEVDPNARRGTDTTSGKEVIIR